MHAILTPVVVHGLEYRDVPGITGIAMIDCQLPPDGRTKDQILADCKRLAQEYYRVTGRPLGVTGEVAEHEAATKMGLELAPPRQAGYDAVRQLPSGSIVKIQIKGRRRESIKKLNGARVGGIKVDHPFDTVMLVLLDEAYDAFEIWEADRADVLGALDLPGSKVRDGKGSTHVRTFLSVAKKVWTR